MDRFVSTVPGGRGQHLGVAVNDRSEIRFNTVDQPARPSTAERAATINRPPPPPAMTTDKPDREHPAVPIEQAAAGRDRVTVVWNGLQEFTARLDGTEDDAALDTLTGAVAELKAQVTALLAEKREKDVPPRRGPARATRTDWDGLIAWVDELNPSHSLLGDCTMPACWPAHPCVEDLAGLHHAWGIAVINDELGKETGSNNLTAWHDRWLWPCLRRMKNGHYRTTNCRDGHHQEGWRGAEDRSGLHPEPALAAAQPPGGCPADMDREGGLLRWELWASGWSTFSSISSQAPTSRIDG